MIKNTKKKNGNNKQKNKRKKVKFSFDFILRNDKNEIKTYNLWRIYEIKS